METNNTMRFFFVNWSEKSQNVRANLLAVNLVRIIYSVNFRLRMKKLTYLVYPILPPVFLALKVN